MTEQERQTAARRRRERRLGKATLLVGAAVAAQVVALEFVLRGWQGETGASIYAGAAVSAALFVAVVVVFLRTLPGRRM